MQVMVRAIRMAWGRGELANGRAARYGVPVSHGMPARAGSKDLGRKV